MSTTCSGRSSSAWLACNSMSLIIAGPSAASGRSTSAPLLRCRFHRRSPTRTAATTRERKAGRAAKSSSSAAAASGAPAPTTSGSVLNASASLPGSCWTTTSPVRSISWNLPPFCHTANGRRSSSRTTIVPGRCRSTVARCTQVSFSIRARAASSEKPSNLSPLATPRAARRKFSGVLSRPSTRISFTTKPPPIPSRSGKLATVLPERRLCTTDNPPRPSASRTAMPTVGHTSLLRRRQNSPTREGRRAWSGGGALAGVRCRGAASTRGKRRSPPSTRTASGSRSPDRPLVRAAGSSGSGRAAC